MKSIEFLFPSEVTTRALIRQPSRAKKLALWIFDVSKIRKDEATVRFRLGMDHYKEGRFGEALPDLQAAAALDPGRIGTRFFLGTCLLLTEKTDEGIEELRKTISLGDSVYLEKAHFYLAKAYLAKGDVNSVKEKFHWVLENGSRLKENAAQILAQLK